MKALRRFLKVIDELALRDLLLQGGFVYLEWWAKWPNNVKIGSLFGV